MPSSRLEELIDQLGDNFPYEELERSRAALSSSGAIWLKTSSCGTSRATRRVMMVRPRMRRTRRRDEECVRHGRLRPRVREAVAERGFAALLEELGTTYCEGGMRTSVSS